VDSSFDSFLEHCQARCQRSLDQFWAHDLERTPRLDSDLLIDACHYSLSNGGKRIRPILTYAAGVAIGSNCNAEALDYATCAIEMIHTYSLIHDDLPAMDDDDLRRGKPSCHKAFDEATAILAGDALHSRAFELLANLPDLNAEKKLAMIKVLAAAAGPRGMVGGQAIDIAATDSELSLSQLQTMHALKTGALIRAALALGGIAGGATESELHALDNYGRHIGLAFQVIDDILDVESDTVTLGKTRGKDSDSNKVTYVKIMGLEGAKTEAQQLLHRALAALESFGSTADHLRDLAQFIVTRNH